jgi:POT family proton-dependent oligopeptide transporter
MIKGISKKDELFGHPKALFMLFSTEMWERFSYYGMRALLVLFLTAATLQEGFGWNSMEALKLYGTYTGLVYLTPLFGGWLADNFLGQRKAIVIGGLLMALGHFLMVGPAVVPNLYSSQDLDVHKVLVNSNLPMGEKLTKNIIIKDFHCEKSDCVSKEITIEEGLTETVKLLNLPKEKELLAINDVKNAYNWVGWSFYLALGCLILGNGFFKPNISNTVGQLYEKGDSRRDSGFTIFYMGINLGAFFGSLICGFLGENVGWHYGFSVAGVGMLIGLLIFIIYQDKMLGQIGKKPSKEVNKNINKEQKLTAIEFDRIKVIMILAIFTVIFWAGFEQAGGAMNLYAYENTDRMLFDFEVPASWFQSLNALFIVLFAPLFASFWVKQGDNELDSPKKFALGLLLLGVGFLCMMGAAIEYGYNGSSNMLWLVGAYLFHTFGELCLSPVGLSMVTKLAPLRLGSLMMGVWFLSSAVANKVGGFVGGYTEVYGAFEIFTGIAVVSSIAAVLLYFLSNKLVEWTHGAEK